MLFVVTYSYIHIKIYIYIYVYIYIFTNILRKRERERQRYIGSQNSPVLLAIKSCVKVDSGFAEDDFVIYHLNHHLRGIYSFALYAPP